MQYRFEPLNYLLNNGLNELGLRSWAEVGNDKQLFKYNPDWARYQRMEDIETLRFMAVRDDADILIGYASIIVGTNIHDRDVLCAVIQDIYLSPENRMGMKSAREFIVDNIEKALKGIGVKHLSIAERENDPRGGVGAVYQRLGYGSNERIWTKEL